VRKWEVKRTNGSYVGLTSRLETALARADVSRVDGCPHSAVLLANDMCSKQPR
jgi:hypothetical protein